MSMTKTLIAALLATLSAAAPAQQLSLSKSGLQLRDDQGQLLATHAVRAKRWDQRRLADGRQVALLQDADSGELRLLEVSGQALSLRARWPAPDFNLEALCLYLEPQQQSLQAFLIADDGLAQQWLLDAGTRAPLMRRLAAAPDVKQCEVRDAEARLYLVEPGVGLWALAADAERALSLINTIASSRMSLLARASEKLDAELRAAIEQERRLEQAPALPAPAWSPGGETVN